MTKVIKIILSDRMSLFCEALADILNRREGFAVVGQAAELDATLRLIREHRPDLLITDWMLGKAGALDFLEYIRKHGMATRVVILTGVRAPEAVGAALAAGASGYVLKDAGLEDFFQALDAVLGGGSYVAPCMRDQLYPHQLEKWADAPLRLSSLTPREREILGSICEGHTSRQIAHRLGISVRTVETHRANLREKLDLRTVADLTAFALANDLCGR